MRSKLKPFIYVLFCCNILLANANTVYSTWFTHEAGGIKLNVELYLSSTCSHCHKANDFLLSLEKKEPWIAVKPYLIDHEQSALRQFYERLKAQHTSNFTVPGLFFCGSHWTGFADAASTGKVLLNALNYCRQQIIKEGALTQPTIDKLQQWSLVNQAQLPTSVKSSSLKYLSFLALTDATTVCSVFCLMTFFAFLCLSDPRTRLQILTGISFILSMVIINCLIQMYPDLIYRWIHLFRWSSLLFGFVLLGYSAYCCRQILNRQKIRNHFFIYVLIATTAVTIQIYQQTCQLNFGLLFQQWLEQPSLSHIKRGLFQFIYYIIYSIPLTLTLLLYVLLNRYIIKEPYQRAFRISSIVILLTVASLFLVYPYLLAHVWLSLLVLFFSSLFWWLSVTQYER